MKTTPYQPYRYSPYLFLSPLIFLFLAINLYPLLDTLFMSFNKWERGSTYTLDNITFSGIQNYAFILDEPSIGQILLNTLIFIPTVAILIHLLALFIAKLVTYTPPYIQALIIIACFAPYMISEGIIAGTYIRPFITPNGKLSEFIIWLNQNQFFMPLMAFLGAEQAQQFLSQDTRDTPVAFAYLYIIICTLIKYFGFFSLIYYIMLRSIKKELIEAATLESSGSWQIFWKIELPQIRKMIGAMFILSLIFLLNNSQLQQSVIRLVEREDRVYFRTFNDLFRSLFFQYSDIGAMSALTWLFVSTALILIALSLIIKKWVIK